MLITGASGKLGRGLASHLATRVELRRLDRHRGADLGVIAADLPEPFVIVNGVSVNTGMIWDLEPGRRVIG